MPATQINSIPRRVVGALTWHAGITEMLGPECDDYDIDAIVAEYTTAVDRHLPDTWDLHGETAYAECDSTGTPLETVDWDDLKERVETDLDWDSLIERHDLTLTERMSAAEFACWRARLGLTLDEIADLLGGLNPRTPRSWETARDPIPLRVINELRALGREHDELAASMLAAGEVQIVRDRSEYDDRPRGWHVAAAAHAMRTNPRLSIEWV